MVFIEWVILIMTVLGIIGGVVFASQGGYHAERSTRILSFVISVAIIACLLVSQLTWVGWLVVGLSTYDAIVALVKIAMHPGGSWVPTGWCIFSVVVNVVVLALLLTFGLVV